MTSRNLLYLVGFILVVDNGCGGGDRRDRSGPPVTSLPKSSILTRTGRESASVIADRTSQPGDWFEDVTARTGVRFAYRNGEESGQLTVLETLGGGVAALDFDQDSDLDLVFTGGGAISSERKITGLPLGLFRNDGDWRFVEATAHAGLEDAGDYSHGCIVGDYDNDGYPDLFVTCYGRSRLFHNQGDGRFLDVTTAAGLGMDAWSTAACWADFDLDGCQDLYVAGYLQWKPDHGKVCGMPPDKPDICGPSLFPGAQDRLFRGRGDGAFEEMTAKAGLSDRGKGLGVVSLDVDEDGLLDIYVANDGTENHLYMGRPGLRFEEVGVSAGVACSESGVPEGSMGVDAGDYDGDGLPDLWVTNFEMQDNALYRNMGARQFQYASYTAGLAGPSRLLMGFGAAMEDFDQDGWLDLFVANGHLLHHLRQGPFRQKTQLFRNREGKRFDEVTERGGPYFATTHLGRGAAVADLDNDGSSDLVISHQNDRVSVLRNRHPGDGWVRLSLRGVRCDSQAVGAKVTMTLGDRRLVRWIRGGAGYLSQFDTRITFPANGPGSVVVTWPGGSSERFDHLASQKDNLLVEGRGNRQ